MSRQLSVNTDTQRVEIVDGSTGYVLLENGVPEDPLFNLIWASRALVEEKYHGAVIKTHKTYIDLGAKYITTNSYACQPTYYEKAFGTEAGRAAVSKVLGADWFEGKQFAETGCWESLMKAHARLSIDLAVKTRAEAGKTSEEVKILGSLPPLVESHRPDLFFEQYCKPEGREFFISHYATLAMEMVQGGSDYLLFETSNCWEEVECGLEAIRRIVRERTGELLDEKRVKNDTMEIEVFVSFEGSLRNGAPKGDPNHLKPQPQIAGTLFQQLIDSLQEGMVVEEAMHPEKRIRIVAKVVGVGFNCAPPEDIVDNLQVLQSEGMLQKLEGMGVKLTAWANLNEREVYDQGFDVKTIAVAAADEDQSSVPPPPDPVSPTSPIAKRKNMVGAMRNPDAKQGEAAMIPFCGYLTFAKQIKEEFGVGCIGGCCGCGPGGIETLAKYL